MAIFYSVTVGSLTTNFISFPLAKHVRLNPGSPMSHPVWHQLVALDLMICVKSSYSSVDVALDP